MIPVKPITTNFASGELSPTMLGRADVERWFSAAQRLENFLVLHQGPMVFRTGTVNCARAVTQASGKVVRMQDFIFSRSDAVAVEISTAGFRFLRNKALILNGGTPVQVSVIYGTSTAISYTDSEIPEMQFAQSADVLFIVHPNHPPATLSRYSDTDWRYELINIDYGPYMDQDPGDQDVSLNCSVPVDRMVLTSSNATEFAPGGTPIAINALVQYSVSGQKVLGSVQNYLGPTSVNIFPMEDFCFALSKEVYSPGAYLGWDSTNSVPLYGVITPGTTQDIAFSATGVVTQDMIGGYVRFCDQSGTFYWLQVTAVSDIVKMGAYGIIATGLVFNNIYIPTGVITRSNRLIKATLTASKTGFFNPTIDQQGRKFRLVLDNTVVHCTGRVNDAYDLGANTDKRLTVYLNRPLPRSNEGFAVVDNGTTNDWNRGAWYVGNYPATVGFHEERLTFASTYDQPQTGWMSKSGDFYNQATTDENLRVLDDSAITFTLASDTINQILWIVSKKVMAIGTAGSEWAVMPGGSNEPLKPTNISAQGQSSWGSEFAKPMLIGSHLIYIQRGGTKLRQMQYNYSSDSWESVDLTVFSNHILKSHSGGKQLAYHHLPESAVVIRLGDGQVGYLTYEADQQVYSWSRFVLGGSGFCESLCSIPEGDRATIYMVVRRTVNGTLVRTIETLQPEFKPASSSDWASANFLDNCTFVTAASNTITGLNDFKGWNVWARVDNQVVQGTVNTSGTLVLPSTVTAAGKTVAIGYSYQGLFQAFPLEVQGQGGTSQGKTKRIDTLVLRVINSRSFAHGLGESNVRDETLAGTDFWSGDVRVPFDNGFDTRASYYILQDKPLPLTVVAIMPQVGVYS